MDVFTSALDNLDVTNNTLTQGIDQFMQGAYQFNFAHGADVQHGQPTHLTSHTQSLHRQRCAIVDAAHALTSAIDRRWLSASLCTARWN